MNVDVEDVSSCRKVLVVDVPTESVMTEYDDVVVAYRKVAKIPGFRKGKAPLDVVERRHAKDITEDTKERLVPRFYQEALEKKQIKPVALLNVSDVVLDKNKGMSFKVTLDVAPEFRLPKYKKISLKRNSAAVDDQEVDEAFDRFLDNFARFEDVVDRPAREGDLVVIDYEGTCDGKPVSEIAGDCAGLGDGKDFMAMVGEPEFLPGFSKGMQGAAVGEQRTIDIEFPDDYHVPAVAGKHASYAIAVKGVREKAPPELNEEFFKRFDVASKDELMGKIRSDLEKAAEDRQKATLKDDVAKFLLSKVDCELPASIVKQEHDASVQSIIRRNIMNGVSKEELEANKDSIFASVAEGSKDRVKLSYILARIAEDAGIEVKDDEVDAHINEMAPQYRMSPAQLRAEIEKKGGMDGLKSDIRSGNTLNFLIDSAKIKDVKQKDTGRKK